MIKINEFNYDLERISDAINGKFYTIPEHMESFEEFCEWLENIKPQDDFEHLEAYDN